MSNLMVSHEFDKLTVFLFAQLQSEITNTNRSINAQTKPGSMLAFAARARTRKFFC